MQAQALPAFSFMSTKVPNLKFSALLAICRIIDSAFELERALNDILRILSEQLSMQRATITLHDPDTGLLNISASYGLTPEEQRRGVYRLDEGVTGRIFVTGEPYYVPDVSQEPLFLNKTGARHPDKVDKGALSFLGAPILVNGEPIGVLNVDRLFPDAVDVQEDMDFLSVAALIIGQFINLNDKLRRREDGLRAMNAHLRSWLSRENQGPYIVGRSPIMAEVQRQIEKVAPTKATVLLLGESGVGKTLIARMIHELSDRKPHPFVKVNCASIPDNLLESELFGYEKGAFTGASVSRPGRFEDADGGTVFLDEVGELPLGLQAKLLRVIQEKEFERLGSNRVRSADVRILAATNRDLGKLSAEGKFRQDLYFRLSVFPITVPPLRDRKEDIPSLLVHFMNKVAHDYGRKLYFTREALDMLTEYDWPGNVREMENLVERLVIMADSEQVGPEALEGRLEPEPMALEAEEEQAAIAAPRPTGATLADIEKSEVITALERAEFIQYKAAEELGLTPRQLGYRVRKFGLEPLIAEGKAKLRRGKAGRSA
jgi:Nif-specific regulatory protein